MESLRGIWLVKGHTTDEKSLSERAVPQSSGPGCTQACQNCGVSGVGDTVPAHGLSGCVNR